MKKKQRLIDLLVARGEADSLERATALVMSGAVSVNGSKVDKSGTSVPIDAEVTVRNRPTFVSRAGHKLAGALDRFALLPAGKICVDVGSATGGFADVLLQRGAARVYCVDVGYGDLAWKVRSDHRVVPVERTNARYLEALPERVTFACVDVSFISLTLIIPALSRWTEESVDVVLLVKPQFEVAQREVGEGGIVNDKALHRRVLEEVIRSAQAEQFQVRGVMVSPIAGVSGNREYLLWVGRPLNTATRGEYDLGELFD